MLESLADPSDPEHEEWSEWAGGDDFDPTYFDLEATNEALRAS